ncbi:hypothetical protein C0Q70_18648 [Pomacea canaliculata]|uniref:Reverse transcriptase domain-containing protein n=1 Tax=Pomacea canaliculata TaxID=400727 RepID=A0A2T7NH76_POMCA|nr:hypothetical protein C0Q70_18648 [Pomacea canaliculata]
MSSFCEYIKLQRKPGLLLLVDFEKAFDSIAHSFIQKALRLFNFGPDLLRWQQTTYLHFASITRRHTPTPGQPAGSKVILPPPPHPIPPHVRQGLVLEDRGSNPI